MVTQGTIFSNAINIRTDNYDRLGLLVSARCDIENKKQSRYHYISVLSFSNWLTLCVIPLHIRDRLIRACNKLGNLINNIQFTSNLKRYTRNSNFLTERNIDGLINFIELFKTQLVSSKEKKENDLIGEIVEISRCLKLTINLNFTEEDTKKYLGEFEKKEFDKISKNLLDGFQGYYFIGSISGLEGQYVAELREIYTVSKDFIRYLGMYGEISEKALNTFQDMSLVNLNRSENEDLKYSIVGEVPSPMIESVMQKFAINFIRIGIDYEEFIYCN